MNKRGSFLGILTSAAVLVACGGTGGDSAAKTKNAALSPTTFATLGAPTTTRAVTRATTTTTAKAILQPAQKVTQFTTTTTPPCQSTRFQCGTPGSPFVLLAFGDSYGSGEGNPVTSFDATGATLLAQVSNLFSGCFIIGCEIPYDTYLSPLVRWWWGESGGQPRYAAQGVDSTLAASSWMCHRSSKSGVAKAVDQILAETSKAMKFGHFACSGAKSYNIANSSYNPEFFGYDTTMPPQTTQADNWLARQSISRSDVDAVVVSIGGNDVHFSDVIKDCFIEAGDCYNESDTIGNRNAIATDIPSIIRNVSSALRSRYPNAKIFFTGYTDGIGVQSSSSYDKDHDGVCSYDDDPWTETVEYDDDEFWDILAVDSRFVKGFLEDLNSTIRRTIESTTNPVPNTFYIGDQFDNYRNNGFCTWSRRNVRFNEEAISMQGADVLGSWSSGAWHPNDYGYTLYGNAIKSKLRSVFSTSLR